MTIDEAISHAREVAECQKMSARLIEDNAYIPESVDKEAITYGNTICANEHEQLAEWLEELKQYRTIGTPEECRAAVEKQIPKKIIHPGCYDNDGIWRTWNGIDDVPYDLCPSCETNLCTSGAFGRDKNRMKYCENCGQKLDWSDEE